MTVSGSGQSALLALDVIQILKTLQISYAVIGAFAASFHGVIRASMDVDLLIALPPGTEVSMLRDRLQRAGLQSIYRTGDVKDPIGGVVNVEDRFHNRVDLLMNIQGMTTAVYARTIEAEFMAERIHVIGVEDFIAMKIFAGGPQDVSDVEGVLKTSSDRIDRTLLSDLVRPYGPDALRTLDALMAEIGDSHRSPRTGE